MVSCKSMIKSVLVAVVLMAVTESGLADEKLASCCKKVTGQKITDPILGYLVQKPASPCVSAVIFQTNKGLFCVHPRAPWVLPKIRAFEKAKRQTTASPSVSPSRVSLLSIITSTASPSSPTAPPSTSPLPSIASTSAGPVGENISDQIE